MADDSQALAVATSKRTSGSSVGEGGTIKQAYSTWTVAAAASANSLYRVQRLPANAVIHKGSNIEITDLASTGSPTLDIGIFPDEFANVTADEDALNNGIDAATAGVYPLVDSVADWGKPLWQIAGLSADPGGEIVITVKILDAATNTGGTGEMLIWYSIP